MRIRRRLMSSISEGWGTSETTTPLSHSFPVSISQRNHLHQYSVHMVEGPLLKDIETRKEVNKSLNSQKK
jgi:hypothetical protein